MSLRRVEQIWGTAISVDVRDPVDPEVLDRVFAWFRHVDDLFSTWRDDSEINRIAHGELSLRDASGEVREVLERCDALTADTRGAFDIRFAADDRVAPREGFGPIDPSGFVKGWALERAATMLHDAGLSNFAINAGGDVLTRGRPDPDTPWRVGIQHPSERGAVAAVVTGRDMAVATSGRYERGDHVIDPRTGQPAVGLVAVTVVGDDLGVADAYATAALVMGEDGVTWLATLAGIEAMAITNDGRVITTERFPLAD